MSCPRSVTLPNGARMPILGFGTWQANDDELEAAIDCALATGYRHIDTAYVYRNEHVVGKVVKKWLEAKKLRREELFIVTKLPNIGNRESQVEKFLDMSLKNLQLDYVDLYLIHTPFGLNYKDDETTIPMKPDKTADLDFSTDLIAIWKKMEEMVDKGKAKAIGVSNFNIDQVKRILQVARIRPATNQVELHVYNQQRALEKYLKSENITLTAYSSLGTGGSVRFLEAMGVRRELPNLMTNPVVKEIAQEVGKTSAQVLLRFVIQRGIATIPKSIKPERIKQNFDNVGLLLWEKNGIVCIFCFVVTNLTLMSDLQSVLLFGRSRTLLELSFLSSRTLQHCAHTVFDFELSGAQMEKLFALDQKARILKFEEIFLGVENHPEYPFKDE